MVPFKFVITYQQKNFWDKTSFIEVESNTAQNAVDKVRKELQCYKVLNCYRRVSKWK